MGEKRERWTGARRLCILSSLSLAPCGFSGLVAISTLVFSFCATDNAQDRGQDEGPGPAQQAKVLVVVQLRSGLLHHCTSQP
jgi:hypothetical protein